VRTPIKPPDLLPPTGYGPCGLKDLTSYIYLRIHTQLLIYTQIYSSTSYPYLLSYNMDIASSQSHNDQQQLYDGTQISTTRQSALTASNNLAPPQDTPVQAPRLDPPHVSMIKKKQISDVTTTVAFLKPLDMKRSWDSFTSNYVKSFVNDEDAKVDAKKRIDSNELIETITQEYNLTNPHKTKKSSSPPKGENSHSLLTNQMENSNNCYNNNKCKKQCCHCSLIGHLVSQCKFIAQNCCYKYNHFGHDADQCL